MKVLVLGGTGSIGAAVVQRLVEYGHTVVGLVRSQRSARALERACAQPLHGDILKPDVWVEACDHIDAVIHAAATWDSQMSVADSLVVNTVLQRLSVNDNGKAFVYTGGCWLYGETGDRVATEESPADELESFAYTQSAVQKVLSAKQVRGMVIHPAMVYERGGGVFEHIYRDAENLGYVRVVKSAATRWPLVHRLDLADLYVRMIEQGRQGDVFNAATNEGVPVGKITKAIGRTFGITGEPVVMNLTEARVEIGDYADGYALDQQMSGDKARTQLGWQPEFTDPVAVVS